MNSAEIRAYWNNSGEQLKTSSLESLHEFQLQKNSVQFLNEIGLPNGAAPFLSFNELSRLTDTYDFLEDSYSKYIEIGADGAGNPLTINTNNNDIVEWLDHDDGFSPNYVNSSIEAFITSLMAYGTFITLVLKEYGEDAIMDARFNNVQFNTLKKNLEAIDPESMRENCFWQDELQLLLAHREEYEKGRGN